MMKKLCKQALSLVLVTVMVIGLLPGAALAYSFTGQDYNLTTNIMLNGVDTGADYTRVHLGSGGSAGWGANRYINIVEVNLSKNANLDFEVINHGSSLMGSAPLPSVVAGYSEDNNTILAAVNGDWMAYANSMGVGVTSNYRVSFSSLLLDGEIWCSQMSTQEQFCDYYTFGISQDRKVLIGKPYVSTTIKNVSTGRTLSATGVNRAPANNGLYVYNNRMGSSNYVPADAYEIAISTGSNKFMNGGTVTGTVKGIYPAGTTSRCALDSSTVVITARGSQIANIQGYFSVGHTVSIATKLTADSNSSFWANCEEATGGQCMVMQNGVVTNDLGASSGSNSHQYPTSILGYRADGTVVMAMVTSDTHGKYVGLQFNKIPEFCKSLGYDTCLLLDGGGSTTMVTLEDGKYVERACYSDGAIRYTWTSLALVYTGSGLIPEELKSVVFDAAYYARRYPDLKAALGNDAAKLYDHFLTSGIAEGRRGSPNFDIEYYVEQNEDLKKVFGKDYLGAMAHFVSDGCREGRVTAPGVDLGASLRLKVKINGLYMGLSDGCAVTTADASQPTAQWNFTRNSDGSYTLINRGTALALDVPAGSGLSGTAVKTYTPNGTDAQKWYVYDCGDGSYCMSPRCSATCVLDVTAASTQPGATIQIYTANGTAAQRITFEKYSPAETLLSSQPVSIGKDVTVKITAAGKNLTDVDTAVLTAPEDRDAQLWNLVQQPDGSYELKNRGTGRLLDAYGGSVAAGTAVITYPANGTDAQKWYLYGVEKGYVFLPKNSAATVLSAKADGSLVLEEFEDLSTQVFTLTLVKEEEPEHICRDANGDYYCDGCGLLLEHPCQDRDGDGLCDHCNSIWTHTCLDADGDHFCDVCGADLGHECVDGNGDAFCDACGADLGHECADGNKDGLCDVCRKELGHACVDADQDFWCDICDQWYLHCVDSNGDYWCEDCGQWIEHPCVDQNNNGLCDYCYLPCTHECVDDNGDYRCDGCGQRLPHDCLDYDGDGLCDHCGQACVHECVDDNGDYHCDGCGQWLPHDCLDYDGDGLCDHCAQACFHECVDANGDFRCDGCRSLMAHQCVDVDEDYICDICEDPVIHECFDVDGDLWCDVCGEWIEHVCLDTNGNGVCDYCYMSMSHDCRDTDKDGFCDHCGIQCPVEEPVLLGDLNGDGRVNIADVSRLYSHVKGTNPLTQENPVAWGDTNGDGRLNIADVSRLYSHVKGTLPLGSAVQK